MSTVYLASRTNSQMFTTCCHAAICDKQDLCPQCKQDVTPKGHAARWQHAYSKQNGGRK